MNGEAKRQRVAEEKEDTPSVCRAAADNIMTLPSESEESRAGTRRPIAIDGQSIAVGHGNGKKFSWKGLQMCIEYFKRRGHYVKAFVPRWRIIGGKNATIPTQDQHILQKLEKDNLLVLTPSKSYDRFVVQYAAERDGIIVSFNSYLVMNIQNGEKLWKKDD